MSGSTSEIHVHCRGLSSIVEYGTTISVVDCVQFSVLVNQCVGPACSLGALSFILNKTKPGTHHIMYHFCSMRLEFCWLTIFIGYFRGLTLFSTTNVVVL